ncbi:MAG: type II secretion system F family protein [Nitrospirae bacterium]|nr:MAG: type II secretion system F family protein [Nitrospirota bacterium]
MDHALLISLMVFAVTLFFMLWAYSLMGSRQRVRAWGERIRGKSPTVEVTQTEKGIAYLNTVFLKILERLGQATKPKDQTETSRLRRALITAGYRGAQAPIIFLGTKLFLALCMVGLFFVFGAEYLRTLPANWIPLTGLACALAGFYAPQFWLSWAITHRKEKLIKGFPDALDLMVVCVEAGLGLDQAIARVGEEIKLGHPELAEEFQLVSLELRAGFTREQALRNLGERTELEDIRSLIALLIQTDRFGTSIAQALRVHSDSMRLNRRLKAEELAAKLPVKLMFPLILFIFPSLLIVIMGPGIIKLMRDIFPMFSQ